MQNSPASVRLCCFVPGSEEWQLICYDNISPTNYISSQEY